MTSFMKAMSKRRTDLKGNEKGFTLIELLVVVIIIGVLAAIAIPIYLTQQDSARDAAAQSDVANLKTAVVAEMVTDPTGAVPAFGDLSDFSASEGVTGHDVVATATGFCVEATSATSKVFSATDTGAVAEEAC